MLFNSCAAHALPPPLVELTLEAAIRWPTAEALQELQGSGLLELWLQRRIEQQLSRLAPLPELRHHWFGSAATSLFLKRRADLDRVVFSILRLRDAELAQELYFRLQAGEADFPQLAHLSEGQESQLGGRLGPINLGQLTPLLAERLRRSSPGQLLPPLELEDGQVLVLRLDLLMPASQDQRLQDQLEQELFENWLSQEQERLLQLEPDPDCTLALDLPGPVP
jgi:parvulin-like peptidyl-prolyl isomerase